MVSSNRLFPNVLDIVHDSLALGAYGCRRAIRNMGFANGAGFLSHLLHSHNEQRTNPIRRRVFLCFSNHSQHIVPEFAVLPRQRTSRRILKHRFDGRYRRKVPQLAAESGTGAQMNTIERRFQYKQKCNGNVFSRFWPDFPCSELLRGQRHSQGWLCHEPLPECGVWGNSLRNSRQSQSGSFGRC